jgi:hypothetical protein
MKSRPKFGRKLQRGDRVRAEHARRLDHEGALDDALKNTAVNHLLRPYQPNFSRARYLNPRAAKFSHYVGPNSRFR